MKKKKTDTPNTHKKEQTTYKEEERIKQKKNHSEHKKGPRSYLEVFAKTKDTSFLKRNREVRIPRWSVYQ